MSNGQSLHSSQELSFSPSRQSSIHFSKVYKQASQLYLTRRLSEALSLLEPIVSAQSQTNGHGAGDEATVHAPIASASTSQRIKLWSLYITLLNSILDLTDEEGDSDFGRRKFKEIGDQVRTGRIWETVVRDGYDGRESTVDSEVVYNLTTLLLGQATDQKLTQRRLEAYLSSSPDLDVSSHLQRSPTRKSRTNGTDTPRDLSARVKIVELFTLHVLPRNDEWEYAHSFITHSDILDEERREAFLQTLEELKEVQEPETPAAGEMLNEREQARKIGHEAGSRLTAAAAMQRSPEESSQQPFSHKKSSSEVDYGIDSPRKQAGNVANGATSATEKGTSTKILAPKSGPPPPSTSKGRRTQAVSPGSKTTPKTQQSLILVQAKSLVRFLQNLIGNATGNPAAFLKVLVFLVALLGVLGKGEVREKLRRVLGGSWEKLKGTIGMGMKVSYI